MEHQLTGILTKLLAFDKQKLPHITTEREPAKHLLDVPAEIYHADRTRMSSSALRKLLISPRSFLAYWQEMKDDEEEKDYFRIGRAAHLFLLEPLKFKELYVVEPVHSGFTKDGKPTTSANAESVQSAKRIWRAQQRQDALIVSQEELDDLVGMMESVLEHQVAAGMLANGVAESTIHWTDPDTGVMCKARPDYICTDKQGDIHLIDFKTTRDVRKSLFSQDVGRNRYHTQLSFYHDGIVQALGKQPKTITIIAVEKKAPYSCVVEELHDDWFEYGQKEYQHALKIYRQCRDKESFPAFQKTASLMNMPNHFKTNEYPEFF